MNLHYQTSRHDKLQREAGNIEKIGEKKYICLNIFEIYI